MLSFKRFIKEDNEEMTIDSLKKELESFGYSTKPITRTRIAIVTDRRQAALSHAQEIFKRMNPKLLKDTRSLNISSLGILQVGNFQIIAKPASKNVLKAEQEATESLVKLIKEAVEQEGKPLTIMIGNYKIENVVSAGADQIRNDPKADIALINDSKNEVGFISHKKEGGAKAYQQYGGISSSAGESIYENPLVKLFVEDLNRIVNNRSARSGESYWRFIPNNQVGKMLVGHSVYGPNWRWGRSKTFNRNSVHCIGQGKPILTKGTNGSYSLTFSEAMHTADDLDWAFTGPYKAILAVTYRAGRNVENGRIKISNFRGGIYPYDFISGRRAGQI
jgi:hypothetical protein